MEMEILPNYPLFCEKAAHVLTMAHMGAPKMDSISHCKLASLMGQIDSPANLPYFQTKPHLLISTEIRLQSLQKEPPKQIDKLVSFTSISLGFMVHKSAAVKEDFHTPLPVAVPL